MRPRKLQSRYVFGLDIAMRNTGVFVYDRESERVESVEVISTEFIDGVYVIESHVRNVQKLVKRLCALFDYYGPSHVYAELPHGGAKSNRAAVMMSLAIGGITGLCASRNVIMVPVTPTQVKKLVREKGSVDKTEVREVVIRVFKHDFASAILPASKREHVYDAAGALVAANL